MSSATRFERRDSFGSTRFYDVETPEGSLRLPSVTTILGQAINKPGLLPWAVRLQSDSVMNAAADLYEDLPTKADKMTRAAYLSTLGRRVGIVRAHAKETAKALNIGSETHSLIEWHTRKDLGQVVGPEPDAVMAAVQCYRTFDRWQQDVHLKPLLIEQTVWSSLHGYAGTMDIYCEIDHEGQRLRAVGDYKTSKAIHPEMLLQVAAYVTALVEMGHAEPPVAGFIVRLPKTMNDPDAEVHVIPADKIDKLFGVFLAVLRLWRWLEEQ